MHLVFDACALIAYLRDETGAEVVESLLLSSRNTCLVHAINLCEVYYDFLRAADKATAQSAISDLMATGLIRREDIDSAFCQEVGKLKANHRLSLADCFAIALSNRMQAELVSSDHHEFEPVANSGICSIKFFR
jgi:PIN domain nuclease of toxin-antitoxin system